LAHYQALPRETIEKLAYRFFLSRGRLDSRDLID